MKTIILIIGIIGLLLVNGCDQDRYIGDAKVLIDLNCDELEQELRERPHTYIRDNELYFANVIDIMSLKECKSK